MEGKVGNAFVREETRTAKTNFLAANIFKRFGTVIKLKRRTGC